MASRIPARLWLCAILCAAPTFARGATPTAAAPASGGVRISIENEYKAHLNFGVLGKGSRIGNDTIKGVLERQGDKYVGVVDAHVHSTQTLSGLAGGCPNATMPQNTYDDSQQLRVTGHLVDGFNAMFQSPTITPSSANTEFLLLEFVPESRTTTQPSNRDPFQDTVVNCHTLIETEATANPATGISSILFLPLNDTRWTMKGGGYIIALPSSGDLVYTDNQVPAPTATGPFEVEKSVWKIRVERLSASTIPPAPPSPATPTLPVNCVEPDPNDPAQQVPSQTSGGKPVCPPPPRPPQSPTKE
jgi:hypothetical protein